MIFTLIQSKCPMTTRVLVLISNAILRADISDFLIRVGREKQNTIVAKPKELTVKKPKLAPNGTELTF